jgi:hypothetical protein
MPDKYEREIEDILRNLKRNEPESNIRKMRRRPAARPGKPLPRLNISEWCLVIAIIAALIAGGWSYINGGGNLITGLLALLGVVCIAFVALSPFIVKKRPSSPTRRY